MTMIRSNTNVGRLRKNASAKSLIKALKADIAQCDQDWEKAVEKETEWRNKNVNVFEKARRQRNAAVKRSTELGTILSHIERFVSNIERFVD